MQGSYVEFSFIEKLHARITEVSPANPGETLNDAVERLIAELDAAEADARECRAERARYGDMMTARLGDCENERDAAREELAIARKVMDKVADQRDAARAEVAELRKTLRKVLDILKSGRSTGRNAIKALFAAEDVVMSALDGDNSAQDAA